MSFSRQRSSAAPTDLPPGIDPHRTMLAAALEAFERDALTRWNGLPDHRVLEGTAIGPAATAIQRMSAADIELSIALCASPTGIPTFYGISRDDELAQSVFFCSGSSANMDANSALLGTVLEIAQSRASFISGLREDVSERIARFEEITYDVRRQEMETWFTPPRTLAMDRFEINSESPPDQLAVSDRPLQMRVPACTPGSGSGRGLHQTVRIQSVFTCALWKPA